MQLHEDNRISAYKRKHRGRKIWTSILTVMACAVVFCTTYALILPAITKESDTYCGLEEHIHAEECYQAESETPICGVEEAAAHSHTDDCYLPVHTHTDECYTASEAALSCGLEEAAAHAHGAECYLTEQPVICGQEASEAHSHDAACYGEAVETLTCQLAETEGHAHTDACYTAGESVLSCGLEEREEAVLNCGLEETEGHSHETACYVAADAMVCELEEHKHDLLCYSNQEADVETAADWEATFADVELTGVWADDVLAIAESQLGYAESVENYEVAEDGETKKGYTRYGAWYGMPYEDWCAMFVSFCLHYAEVDADLMPQAAECQAWIDELRKEEYGYYQAAGAYVPNVGDLVFFDRDDDDKADHVGLVAELIEGTETEVSRIKTIEGNSSDKVQNVTYSMDDAEILGYAQLPAQLTEEEQAEVDEVIAMIDEMPSADEIDAKIEEFEEAEDYEGEEAWLEETYQEVARVYHYYDQLSDNQKKHVNNADKLLELEYIWSRVTYIDEIASDAPTPIASDSTRDFIELNLYDYNSSINTNYNTDKDWPGFQWNGGAYLSGTYSRRKIDHIDFGNSMITDNEYAGSSNGKATTAWNIGNQGGNINAIVEYPDDDYANKPVGMSNGTNVLNRTLNTTGYPSVINAGSMEDYFSNSSFSTKKNTRSIDGLFQIKDETGAYYYNSRLNHAQFNSGTDTFTLYEDIITPNFITYPFGNFLPFNDITNGSNATQVSKISSGKMGTYVQEVINDLVAGAEDATEQQLIDMLAKYRDNLKGVTILNGTAWTKWSAKDAIYDYIGNGPTDDTGPITNALLEKMYNIDWDVDTNFFFGMEMKMNFMQPKGGKTGTNNAHDMKFYFTGDDDVWVYVDGVLFLDLSGIHRHVGGEIDFVKGKVHYYALDPGTGDVSTTAYKTYTFKELLSAAGKDTSVLNENGTFKDYTTHKFNFYYMERGSGSSVCRMEFNFPLLKQNSISVEKEVTADGEMNGNPDYMFQVLKANSTTDKTENLFIAANTPYTLYDTDGSVIQEVKYTYNADGTIKSTSVVDKNGNAIAETNWKKTDANGVFTLKAGQRAEFTGIKENAGKYYVRELFDPAFQTQYGSVTVSGASATKNNNVTVGTDTFIGMESPVKDMSDGATAFRFINDVDMNKYGSLEISKDLTKYHETSLDKIFKIEVTLDGEPLPVGTKYTVTAADGTETTKTVETAGIIQISGQETAKIENILAGTTYTVVETAESAKGYTVTYKQNGEAATLVDGKVSGKIQVNTPVEISVLNTEKGTAIHIPGYKHMTATDGTPRSFTFDLVEVKSETDLTPVEGGVKQSATAENVTTIDPMNAVTFDFNISYTQDDIGTYYYLITEQQQDGVLENDTYYVAEVTVSEQNELLNAKVTSMWKDGVALTSSDQFSAKFENTLLGNLTLSKTVPDESAQNQEFTFTIHLDAGTSGLDALPTSYTAKFHQQDGTTVDTTVTMNEEGNIVLNGFKGGETAEIYGIPYGTVWTITESNNEGFKVTYAVTVGETTTDGAGNESTGSITTGTTTVAYTNVKGYKLPDTGGAGTILYTMAGLLMALTGTTYLMYRFRKLRRQG